MQKFVVAFGIVEQSNEVHCFPQHQSSESAILMFWLVLGFVVHPLFAHSISQRTSAREHLRVTSRNILQAWALGLFAELKHLNDPVLGLPQWLHSALPISSSPGSEVHWVTGILLVTSCNPSKWDDRIFDLFFSVFQSSMMVNVYGTGVACSCSKTISQELGPKANVFWSLRDNNRPRRSVSSRVPIKPNMFYVGPL